MTIGGSVKVVTLSNHTCFLHAPEVIFDGLMLRSWYMAVRQTQWMVDYQWGALPKGGGIPKVH